MTTHRRMPMSKRDLILEFLAKAGIVGGLVMIALVLTGRLDL